MPQAQPVISHTLTLMSSKDSPGLLRAGAGEWRQAACGQREAEVSLGVQEEAETSACHGRAPGSTGRTGNGSVGQAALPSTQRQLLQVRGAGTSQPPPSTLTCTLDFFFAFSTDFTVSPAADRAAIRDSISDIFRRSRKDKVGGWRIHQWLCLPSVARQSICHGQALTSLSACCT